MGQDYGHRHRKLRQQWAKEISRGGIACARCGYPIHDGQPWDLGHRDDGAAGQPAAHRRAANRAAGGWKRWHPNGTTTTVRRWAL